MTPKKLAILHTTPVTVESLKALVAEEIGPDCEVVNLLDDSILPELARNGGNVQAIRDRYVQYAKIAESLGADAILGACSSVGELAKAAAAEVRVPVLRIDEAMAEEAVRRGGRIGVAATLATTLAPTTRLLEEKARELNADAAFVPMLASEAYKLLIAGDREGHDRVLGEALMELRKQCDTIVLAQASMARVVASLPEEARGAFLTSPVLGVRRVAALLRH